MPTGQRRKERTSDEREKTQSIGVEGKKSNLVSYTVVCTVLKNVFKLKLFLKQELTRNE